MGLLVALVLLFGGLYVAAHYLAADKVPRNTTVSGVRIGGHPQAEAAQRLQAGLADKVARDIATTIDGTAGRHRPRRSGPGGRLRRLGRRGRRRGQLGPGPAVELLHRRRHPGGQDHARRRHLQRLPRRPRRGARRDAPRRRGPLRRQPGGDAARPAPVRPSTPPRPLAALRAAFLEDAPDTVALEMADVVPDIDAGDVQEALNTFASPAVAAPVVLGFDGSSVKVFPGRLHRGPQPGADRRRAGPDPRRPRSSPRSSPPGSPAAPGRRLRRAGRRHAAGHPRQAGRHLRPRRARGGLPRHRREAAGRADARPHRPGRQAGVHHQGRPRAEGHRAGLDLLDLLPLRRVPQRQPRARRRADQRHPAQAGRDVLPQRHGGERTEANGFTKGYIISDGILVQDLGGGVSQIATTTFNAMFFAGLEDVEHKPHSFYIDRYPIGREATVAWGAVDLRFRNDTPYGVLIQADVTPSTPVVVGHRDGEHVLHEVLGHHHHRPASATTSPRRRPRRIDDLKCHANTGLRRLRHRRRPLLHPGRRQHRDPRRRGLPHDLHPQRHGHLHQPRRRRRVGRPPTASAGAGRAGRASPRGCWPPPPAGDPALQPDREPAVRWHPVPERLQVGRRTPPGPRRARGWPRS